MELFRFIPTHGDGRDPHSKEAYCVAELFFPRSPLSHTPADNGGAARRSGHAGEVLLRWNPAYRAA